MVTGKFTINGIDWVTVRLENGIHVMPETDWKKIYGKLHPERWNRR